MKPEELELLIRAKNPIVSIETPDEPRVVQVVRVRRRFRQPEVETTNGIRR